MKKKKAIIIPVVIITVIACLLYYTDRYVYPLFPLRNTIQVSAQPPLNKEKITIFFGISVNTISRKNDTELFSDLKKYTTLYQSGRLKDPFINEYGENDFMIVYDDKYYFSFRQFKTNRNANHTYKFDFKEDNGIPSIRVKITGLNGTLFERPMNKIEDAEKLRCNTPVDSAGYIYNMIELVSQ
jgi:hypothetical protein